VAAIGGIPRRRLLGAVGAAAGALSIGGLAACSNKPEGNAYGGGPSPSPSATARDLMLPSGDKVLLGVYLKLKSMDQVTSLELRRSELRRDFDLVHWFYLADDHFPAKYPVEQGSSRLMFSWHGGKLEQTLTGARDELIRTNARLVASYKKPMFLRWAWEMNGDWFDHSGPKNGRKPADYIRAWRRVYDIFTSEGATNAVWVWCPFERSVPDEKWNAVDAYYPGDDYVDWVGIDGYPSSSASTPESIFDYVYRMYADRKPIMLSEVAIGRQSPQVMAEFVDQLNSWIQRRPGVKAMVWFDTDLHPEQGGYGNYTIDQNTAILDAYRRLVLSPRFSQS